MKLITLEIPDVRRLDLSVFEDKRGKFVKTFEKEIFSNLGIPVNFTEEFFSISHKAVIRGLHFQTPPHDHFKLVHCLKGSIFDAVVDIRKGSPFFGRSLCLTLTDQSPGLLLIPPGFAHGFQVLSQEAIICYKVTSSHAPENDEGIHWTSGAIDWPIPSPILSQKDQRLPRLDEYCTPFSYSSAKPSAGAN